MDNETENRGLITLLNNTLPHTGVLISP